MVRVYIYVCVLEYELKAIIWRIASTYFCD